MPRDLNEAEAREIIAPWYSLFNVATRGDVRAVHEAVLTDDYETSAGYLPGESWGRETSIAVVSNFANTIPDMKFDIKEVLVAGERVIVRGRGDWRPPAPSSARPTAARAFGSWRSTSRRSAAAG